MDRDDGPRPRCHRRLDGRGINEMLSVLRIDGHGNRTDLRHGEPRRDERVGGDDDLVARPDTYRAQGQREGIETVPYADAVPCSDELRPLGLELGDLSTTDVRTGTQYLADSGLDLEMKFVVGRTDVEERDSQGPTSARKSSKSRR